MMLFQSTLPRRERLTAAQTALNVAIFQSTLPRRERQRSATPAAFAVGFQSTLPRRERLHQSLFTASDAAISIHAPAKGATAPTFPWRKLPTNFNPRSREGSDTSLNCRLNKNTISIHAPAKGATAGEPEYRRHVGISIHAPAKGATISMWICSRRGFNFNPRSREGSDDVPERWREQVRVISIHAPAKGATLFCLRTLYSFYNFNPRSREGSDILQLQPLQKKRISIHAPAKGATYRGGCCHPE